MKKWFEKFNDEEFSNYNLSGEATAVHIVRDRAFGINTSNKWIDVLSFNRYKTEQHKDGFYWIIVELFPRITHPNYTNDKERNKYLCWRAAHDDIATHREKHHHGEKYIVLCKNVTIDTDDPNCKYDYFVTAFRKIKQKKINYINDNAAELANRMKQNKEPTLAILNIR